MHACMQEQKYRGEGLRERERKIAVIYINKNEANS